MLRSKRFIGIFAICLFVALGITWLFTNNLRGLVGIAVIPGAIAFLVAEVITIATTKRPVQPVVHLRLEKEQGMVPVEDRKRNFFEVTRSSLLLAVSGGAVGFCIMWSMGFSDNRVDWQHIWTLTAMFFVLGALVGGLLGVQRAANRRWRAAVTARSQTEVDNAVAKRWQLLGVEFEDGNYVIDLIDGGPKHRITVEHGLVTIAEAPHRLQTVEFTAGYYDGYNVLLVGPVILQVRSKYNIPPLMSQYTVRLTV